MSSASVISKKRKFDASVPAVFRPRQSSIIAKSSNPLNPNGTSNCFHKVKTSLYVSLAPSSVQAPIQGIKTQHLDPLVMVYYPPVKGIVLGYSNIHLEAGNKGEDQNGEKFTVAKINHDTPFAFLWVAVEMLVWRPCVGDIVEGWVYMQTQSHIGLLIHDCFNASIKKFNIPSTWEFVPNQADEMDIAQEEGQNDNANKVRSLGYWIDEKGVPVDGKVVFTIKALHTAGRVVSVEGTLITPGAESDSLPVTVSQKHKKFDDNDTVVTVTSLETVGGDTVQDADDMGGVPKYEKNSDDEKENGDEVVAEENSSSSDDSDSD